MVPSTTADDELRLSNGFRQRHRSELGDVQYTGTQPLASADQLEFQHGGDEPGLVWLALVVAVLRHRVLGVRPDVSCSPVERSDHRKCRRGVRIILVPRRLFRSAFLLLSLASPGGVFNRWYTAPAAAPRGICDARARTTSGFHGGGVRVPLICLRMARVRPESQLTRAVP